jgi:hypothetical protein
MTDDLPTPPPGILPPDEMMQHFEAIERILDIDGFRAGPLGIKDEDEAKAMSRWYVARVAAYFMEDGVPLDSAQYYSIAVAVGFRQEWREAQAGRRPPSAVCFEHSPALPARSVLLLPCAKALPPPTPWRHRIAMRALLASSLVHRRLAPIPTASVAQAEPATS